MVHKLEISVAALAWGVLFQTAAHGQAAPPSAAGPARAPVAATSVGEVVVTAQRRSERLVDVPISVTALSADDLAKSNVTATGDLGHIVPGLTMDISGPFSQPTVRGIGSSVTGPGIGTSVATYIDGYYQPSANSNDFQLADVSSVQVLKGPQGTLFGHDATGGAILVTTLSPTFTPSGSALLSYGSFNDVRAQGVFSDGITDKIAAYGAIFYHSTDGFSKNVVSGRHDQAGREIIGRAKLLYEPTSKLKFTLAYAQGDIDNPYGIAENAYHGITDAALTPGALVPTARDQTANSTTPIARVLYNSTYLTSELDLGFASLKSYTGWRVERDHDVTDTGQSNVEVVVVDFAPRDKTFTQEINLSSTKPGRFQWVTGVFYLDDRAGFYDLNLGVPGSPLFHYFEARTNTDAISGYADGTYRVGDNLFLTAGARVNSERVQGNFASILSGFTTTSATDTFNNVSPRGVIRYEFSPSMNVYASVTEGYKAGTINTAGLSTAPVQPEKVTAYEIGFKTAQRGTHFELAGYYYDYKDLQFVSYSSSIALLQNVAKARIYGLDAHLTQDVTEDLQLDLGATYTNARYVSFPGAEQFFFSPTAGVTSSPGDASGNRMIRTPEFAARAALDYHHPLMGGTGRLNVSYYYQSSEVFDPFGDTRQGGYGILDARASWTDPTNKWTLSVYGENLTDKTYLTQVFQESEAFPQTYGTPINFRVEVSTKF